MLRRPIVLVTLCAAALLTPAAEAVDLQLTLGVETGGELDLGDLERDGGFNLGLEVVQDLPLLEVGAGLEHSFARDVDGGGELAYTLVYGVARLYVLGPLYAAARYGYTDVSLDHLLGHGDDGGATWSIGGGVSLIDKLKAEALYTSVGGDLDYDGYQVRLVYNF